MHAGTGHAQTTMTPEVSSPLLQCQPSEQSGQAFLPNFETFYFSDRVVAWFISELSTGKLISAERSLTYIFTIPADQANCSGSVVAMEFCYLGRDSDLANGSISRRIFEFLQLTQVGDLEFLVTSSIQVTSVQTNDKCTVLNSERPACCDRTELNAIDIFQIPQSEYTYAITSKSFPPLTFSPDRTEYHVEHFQASLQIRYPTESGDSFTLSEDEHISNQSLPLIRLIIGTALLVCDSSTSLNTFSRPIKFHSVDSSDLLTAIPTYSTAIPTYSP